MEPFYNHSILVELYAILSKRRATAKEFGIYIVYLIKRHGNENFAHDASPTFDRNAFAADKRYEVGMIELPHVLRLFQCNSLVFFRIAHDTLDGTQLSRSSVPCQINLAKPAVR